MFVAIDLEPIGIAVVSQLSRAGVCSNRVTRRPGLVPTLSERASTKPIQRSAIETPIAIRFIVMTRGYSLPVAATSRDAMSIVIMKPFVPLYSNALSPTR